MGTGIDVNEQIIGTQRLYPNLVFQLRRSSSSDYDSPVISGIDIEEIGETRETVNVTIEASDVNDIARILILELDTTTGEMTQVGEGFTSDPPSNDPTFTINIPNPGDNSIIIQVVDGAGNVATVTGKGGNLNVISVIAEPNRTVNENT